MESTKYSSDSAKLNDSNIFFMDCHSIFFKMLRNDRKEAGLPRQAYGLSRNDGFHYFMDCQDSAFAESRNYGNRTPFCDSIKYHATNRKTILAMMKWQDSTQITQESRNDKRKAIP